MIYPYLCPGCQRTIDIYKSVSECSNPEACPDCGAKLIRQYTAHQVSIAADSYYNHGLGCKIDANHTVKDRLREIKDTTGREMVEIGTEKPSAGIKAPKPDYKFSSDQMRDMCNSLTNKD